MPVDPYGYEVPIADQALLFDPYGDEPWYVDPLNRGLDVLGAWASRSPYVSPDDPRHRPHQTTVYQNTQATPAPQLEPSPQPGPPPEKKGDITISSNMAMLIGGAVLLFMLGSKKGR